MHDFQELLVDLGGKNTGQESQDEDFLTEIVETSATATPKEMRPQRAVEWPEFMAMRCRIARDALKEKLRKEAKLMIYGFVPSLPLYSFDLKKPSLLKRPDLSDVKSPLFQDFVDYVHELGFSCFIDRPGLISWCDRGAKHSPSPEVKLSDFGVYDFQYFEELGVPQSRTHLPRQVHWALYVLLPGQEAPDFSLKRYFRYNHDPFALRLFLVAVISMSIPVGIFTFSIHSMIAIESDRAYGSGTASEALIESNKIPEETEDIN